MGLQLKRQVDNSSIQGYVYTITELNKDPAQVKFGSKNVLVFKPDEFKITKDTPSENNLKKINIRGSIKEGNSSGRFYMAYLDKNREIYSGCLIKVPDMGGRRVRI